jgi:hypothetical protein
MKIEQVHVKHKTWNTRVTTDNNKTFGLQKLDNGYRVHIPFGGNEHKDFETAQAALAFCKGEEGQLREEE